MQHLSNNRCVACDALLSTNPAIFSVRLITACRHKIVQLNVSKQFYIATDCKKNYFYTHQFYLSDSALFRLIIRLPTLKIEKKP